MSAAPPRVITVWWTAAGCWSDRRRSFHIKQAGKETMILLQFRTSEGLHLGVKTQQGAVDVTAALNDTSIRQSNEGVPASLVEVCAGGTAVCEALDGFVQHLLASDSANRWLLDEARLTYEPCV